MFKVIMSSDVYGGEEFEYDTRQEAEAGMARLKTRVNQIDDGVERYFEIEEG